MATASLGVLLRHIHQLAGEPPGSTRSLTDRQLLDEFAARRDESAFAALVARHGPMVLRVCRRVLGHEQDAEDAFQATFLVLARNLGSIRKRESVANWLHGVAYRTAMRTKRSAARRRNHEKRAATPEPTTNPTWDEVQGVLDEEIQRLPEQLRRAFVLRVLEDKSGPEAAAELGCREGTLASRLLRARRRLQSRLARRGIQLTALLAALSVAEGAKATLPAALTRLAVRSGLLAAAGRSTAALIPGHVAALAAGVTRAMFLSKVKIAVAILCSVCILSAFCVARTLASSEEEKQRQEPAAAKQQAVKEEGIRLRGRVLDPDGKPVASASLYWPRLLKQPPQSEDDYTLTMKATTDAKGRFQLNLKPSEMASAPRPYLIAAADGFGFDWTELSKDENSAELTLRLVKDAPVQGRVLDTQGKPLAGVKLNVTGVQVADKEKVDAYLTTWKQNWHDVWRATPRPLYALLNKVLQTAPTDKDGRFTIRGLGVERVATVEVSGSAIAKTTLYVVTRPGFDSKPYNRAVLEDQRMRLSHVPSLYGPSFDYIAAPTRVIEGAIRDVDTGKPIAGARVFAVTGRNTQVSAVSDAQGNYKLTGLPKMDEYLVGVSPPNENESNLLPRTIGVPGLEGLGPIKQDIELAHGVAVTGQIIDKSTGKGVQGDVRFAPLPENTFFGKKPGYDGYRRDRTMISTDTNGNFRIVVIPGPGVLMAQVDSRNEKFDGQPVNPFRSAEFDVEDAKRVKMVNANGEDRHFTAAGNSVEFLRLESVVKVLDFPEGTEKATVTLSAERGKTLTVRVEDSDGKPLPGAIVSGMTELWPITFSLEKAEWTIYALDGKRQRHVVFYHRERKLAGHIIVRGNEKEAVTVRLEPVGAVTGRLLDPDGQPIAGVEVSLSMPLQVESELFRYLNAQKEPVKTDKDGRFRLDGVMPKLIFQLGLRKGRTYYTGEPKIGSKQVGAGKTLDLGDVHVKGTQF
jgi:RNA polymerase sigma factor (sigma-70 family)